MNNHGTYRNRSQCSEFNEDEEIDVVTVDEPEKKKEEKGGGKKKDEEKVIVKVRGSTETLIVRVEFIVNRQGNGRKETGEERRNWIEIEGMGLEGMRNSAV